MSRISRLSIIFTGLGLIALAGPVACERVPLLAPTGTVINLTLASDIAALNSSVDVIAVLIENGGSSSGTGTGTGTSTSTTAAGTPVQNGTVVSFTTTIGTIEPSEARTTNGKVMVKLMTNGASGKATVTAYSGGAKSTAQITIGAAAVERVLVSASPASLPSNGGSTTVSARVEDVNGNPLAGVPVQFNATKGTLSPQSAVTNSGGVATSVLTTTVAADVTATAGAKTSTPAVTVAVAGKSSLQIALSGSNTAMSTPISFTVTPSTTVAPSNVVVDYGDGTTGQLGTLSAATTVQHFYSDTGIFNVKVSGTDPDGVAVSAQTQVAITGLSGNMTSSQGSAGSAVVFTANIVPAAAVIDHYEWDFDSDGIVDRETDGNQTSRVLAPGTRTVTVHMVPRYGSSHEVTVTIQVAVS